MISIIVAVARNNVIGGQNKLLWHLPADLRRFKEITSGHPIIMGRKTFESIGRPLPNRRNIVITRGAAYAPSFAIASAGKEGIEVAHSLDEALVLAGVSFPRRRESSILDSRLRGNDEAEVFIIGGGEIFREALPLADRIYLTKVDADFEGDVFFPPLGGEWQEISREEGIIDEKNVYPHTFITLARRP